MNSILSSLTNFQRRRERRRKRSGDSWKPNSSTTDNETSSDGEERGEVPEPFPTVAAGDKPRPYYIQRPSGSLIRSVKLEEDRKAREARKSEGVEKGPESDSND